MPHSDPDPDAAYGDFPLKRHLGMVATTSVLRRGRHVVHLEGRVEDADGELVATASGTFAILGD